MIPIMTYTFDTILAKKYGVNEAIMLNNFIYWIAKNEANDKHFHDGRYWTYNSVAAFEKLFPFWSNKQVRNVLASLERQGVLLKGNYNEQKYDRTCWYAFTDAFVKSISQNGKIDLPKTANGIDEKGEPIPDNKPNVKNTDIKPATADAVEAAPIKDQKKNIFDFGASLVAEGVTADHVARLMEIRKAKRLNNTKKAYDQLIESIHTICNMQGVTTDEVVAFMVHPQQNWGAIRPGWAGVERIKPAVKRSMKTMSIADLIDIETSKL